MGARASGQAARTLRSSLTALESLPPPSIQMVSNSTAACMQGLCERWRWAQPAAELNGTVEREKKSLNGGGLFGHAAAMTLANAKRFMKTGHAHQKFEYMHEVLNEIYL